LLSKQQKTALVAPKEVPNSCKQVASKLLQLAFTCQPFLFANWKFQNVLENVLHEQKPHFSHSCTPSNKNISTWAVFFSKGKHSCPTTSRGLSQMARKKRMFFRTFFTWNNTFFATLVHQATKARAHGLFFRTSLTTVCSCTFQVSFKETSLYKYKHIARQFLRAYTQRIQFSHSREYSKKYS
jgi:hypothetical protein